MYTAGTPTCTEIKKNKSYINRPEVSRTKARIGTIDMKYRKRKMNRSYRVCIHVHNNVTSKVRGFKPFAQLLYLCPVPLELCLSPVFWADLPLDINSVSLSVVLSVLISLAQLKVHKTNSCLLLKSHRYRDMLVSGFFRVKLSFFLFYFLNIFVIQFSGYTQYLLCKFRLN